MNISAKINDIQETLRTIYASKEYQDELSQYKASIEQQCLLRYEQCRPMDTLVLSKYIAEALRREYEKWHGISNVKSINTYVTGFGNLRVVIVDVDEPVIIVG